jgi:beta-glucuronidase
MIAAPPAVRGVSPWVLKDFRSPMRLLPGVQDHWNRKGILAEDGEPKLAFETLRDRYREWKEQPPHRPE